jgi:hypothetical protein
MIDNMLIYEISSDITYGALHFEYFCRDFYQVSYNVTWQDISFYILFVLVNFVFVGSFRLTIRKVKWSSCQLILLKVCIIVSSISYIAVGFLFIYGKDKLDVMLSNEKSKVNGIKILSIRDLDKKIGNFIMNI